MAKQRAFTGEEIDALLGACTGTDCLGHRAAIRLGLAGLRTAELAALRGSDIEPAHDDANGIIVAVRSTKHRRLRVTGEAANDILAFMDAADDECQFYPGNGAGAAEGISFRSLRHSTAAGLLRGSRMPPEDPAVG